LDDVVVAKLISEILYGVCEVWWSEMIDGISYRRTVDDWSVVGLDDSLNESIDEAIGGTLIEVVTDFESETGML